MIQFYINSRPVPRAVARHHIWMADPSKKISFIDFELKKAVSNNLPSVKYCAAYGVSVSII